jgi:hypothetical protein
MKPVIIALFAIVALAALIAGFALTQPTSGDNSVLLTINADRGCYSPNMSSTVGIGLTPGYPATVDNRTVTFHWQTDYGHFISWKAPDFKVIEQGAEVTTDDGKIYWSYPWEEPSGGRPPVRITLTMIDRATGETLGTALREIGWGDPDVAVVKTSVS